MSSPHTVICTAGHIDHGKSSLIENLTGFNPDTLREEREREMTIELGFAFYGDTVTFIDVPGHEKFLKTMLAGASSVDGAILVVAADDGIMPQTREHFEILQLMGVRNGIIALTKIDLVEEDWLDLVTEDLKDLTAGTFLEGAPILPLSNRSLVGLDEFKDALETLIKYAPERKDRGLFRMWLDRSFSIKGSGTIVAGTVLSGTLKVGEKVEILPDAIEARVKNIQVHKNDKSSCVIGERAALNLPGVDKDSVHRGDLMATPGHYRPTYMLNARLLLLTSVKKPIETRTRLRLHLGSSEHICRVVLLNRDQLIPGDSCHVQFRLESRAMADIGDRYVIRSFSEGRVLGGGTILETHPRKMKSVLPDEIDRLSRLESAEPQEIIRQYIEKIDLKTADAQTIAREAAQTVDAVIDIISALRRDGEVKVLQGAPKWIVVNHKLYDECCQKILEYLEEFHKNQPYLKGARRSDIKAGVMPAANQFLFESVVNELIEGEKIRTEGELVWQVGHKISFTSQQVALKERIQEIFRSRYFTPPAINEIAEEVDIKADEVLIILTGMCELEILKKLFGPDGRPIYYHSDAVEEARRKLIDFFKTKSEMRFTEYRQLIDSTRRFTTPLLMYFDSEGITLREGEIRILRYPADEID